MYRQLKPQPRPHHGNSLLGNHCLQARHWTLPPVPLTTDTAHGHCWNQWHNIFAVPVFCITSIDQPSLGQREQIVGLWGFIRGRMGPASIKTLARGCSDAGRISKGWELRQINPDILMSETCLSLAVDTCHSYISLSFTDLFSQFMRNENTDLRSSSCRPDVNGLPNLKVKSSLLSPCRRCKRSCPENWRMKKEALSRPR